MPSFDLGENPAPEAEIEDEVRTRPGHQPVLRGEDDLLVEPELQQNLCDEDLDR